jgi:hypothetical protein
MNGAASGLIEAIKFAIRGDTPPYTYPPEPSGTDWDYIPTGPTSWFMYGGGGGVGWGTVCGVPYMCLGVLNMMNLHGAKIADTNVGFADQIMLHYAQTEFPPKGLHDIYMDPDYQNLFGGKMPAPDDEVLAYDIPHSQLCHVSVSQWMEAAGTDGGEKNAYGIVHKNDRCAKVTADVAAFTAGLLNGVTSNYEIPDSAKACMYCHQLTDSPSLAQQGKLNCLNCHVDNEPHVQNGWR